MVVRRQVPDLSPPERLISAPLPSDRYAPPPRPPSTNQLEQLARGLGAFARGVSRWEAKQRAEADEQQKAKSFEEWNKWRATHTDEEFLNLINAGKLPYYHDPYLKAVVEKEWGRLEGIQLGRTIDKELAEGQVPINQTDFNIERYLLEKTPGVLERLQGNPNAVHSFRQAMESLRKGLTEKHHAMRGAALRERVENIAYGKFLDGIKAGVEQGYTGAALMGQVRPMYRELGPRITGGGLNLPYPKLDELFLRAADDLASDPKYAQHVIDLLQEDRADVNNGTRLGSFLQTAKHAQTAQRLISKASKTLSTEWQAQQRQLVLQRNVESFANNPLSPNWSLIKDIQVTDQWGFAFSYTAEQQRKDAVRFGTNAIRVANGGKPNLDLEMRSFSAAGEKHPEWFGMLENAYGAFALMPQKGSPDPAALGRVAEAGTLFNELVLRNREYIEDHMDKDTYRFFSQYNALTQQLGLDPMNAANRLIAAQQRDVPRTSVSLKDLTRMVEREVSRRREVFAIGSWFRGITNADELARDLIPAVQALTATMSADQAIEFAVKAANEKSMYVNGRVIFKTGALRHYPHTKFVEQSLDAIWKKFGTQFENDPLVEASSGSDLSIMPIGRGQFQVVTAAHGHPLLVRQKVGDKIQTNPLVITERDILKYQEQSVLEEQKRKMERTREVEEQKLERSRKRQQELEEFKRQQR
jgi:hypothetical protein